MKPFTYERASSPAAAASAAARIPEAKFIAGGTNLLDLMKLQIETPMHLIDVNGLALDKIEPTPDGGLRIGALVRNTDLAADPPRPTRLWPAVASARLGSDRTTAQSGNDGWQSAPAHTLPLFLRYQHALQQTPAGQRLFCDRRIHAPPRRGGGERCLHRDPSERHGGRAQGS